MNSKGFTIVEVLIGAAIIALFVAALSAAFSLYVSVLPERIDNIKASFLAQEGMEVIKYIRNEGWDANIATLSNDTDYHLLFSGGAWSTTTTPQIIDGVFERVIVLEQVERDANSDIASSGTVDLDARKVTVTVSWDGGLKSESLETYITDIIGN